MYNRVFWERNAYKYPKQDRRLRSIRESGERGTWRLSHIQKDTKVGQPKLGWKDVLRSRKTKDHKHYRKTTNKNIGGSDRSRGDSTGAGAQVRKSRPAGQWCHHGVIMVALRLRHTLFPSSGNMCLHISEICFWHRWDVIPDLNFLLELEEACLFPCTTCKVITDVTKPQIYGTPHGSCLKF